MNMRKWICWAFQVYLLCVPFNLSFDQNQPQQESSLVNGHVYRQIEVLKSSKGLFGVLEWTVHKNLSKITFNLTKSVTSTQINIVLGLSQTGNLNGADLVILTKEIGGTYNIANMIGTSVNTIEPNSKQLWSFEGAKYVEDHNEPNMIVSISRELNPCNLKGHPDICINDNMLHILWGSDTVDQYQPRSKQVSKTFIPEGTLRAYLTDPQVYPTSSDKNKAVTQAWRVSTKYQLPKTRRTSYWCTIQQAPSLSNVHHIIGYIPYFSNSSSQVHVHHQLFFRCKTPPGVNATQIFKPLLEHKGEECILEESHQIPMQLCTELIYGWSVGGKPFYFPYNVGIPIGETRDEYFLLQTHYDNPSMAENLVVESGVDLVYSPKIRQVEPSLLMVGVGNMGLYMVPPNSQEFRIGGVCSSECTKNMFSEGANIMAVFLHAHMATHQIFVRHFRGNEELSVILQDENYDARFQIMRHLKKPVRIAPGDQLGVECVLSTGNKAKLSGLSTRDEMCFVFLLLDKRTDYIYCSSEYPTGKTLGQFGVQKVSWDRELQERVIRKSEGYPNWEGKTLQSFLDSEAGIWSESGRRDLERKQMYGEHDSVCPPVRKLVRDAYSLANLNKSELLRYQKIISEMGTTTETVSTPGFIKAKVKWPQTREMERSSRASGAGVAVRSKFNLGCFYFVLFVLTLSEVV